jgi:hypothetical protein
VDKPLIYPSYLQLCHLLDQIISRQAGDFSVLQLVLVGGQATNESKLFVAMPLIISDHQQTGW